VIRRFEAADASSVTDLHRVVAPAWVFTERGLLHWVESEPERARMACWVALEDGKVVGWCDARYRWEFGGDSAGLFVAVDPPSRRRGLGGELFELGATHLADAKRIYCEATGGEDARRFLLARGYREDRAERISALDPKAADLSGLARLEQERATEGFRAVALAELADRVPDLHVLFEATDADAPHSEELLPTTLEEWSAQIYEQPDLHHEASVVVLAPDGRPVSFSWLHVDPVGGRAVVEMTGTLREFRRRGLARLAKLKTIRWARENGITTMYTGNDTDNAAMLALNDELGFRPQVVYQDFVKELR
jgi:GNAT superfamily N-acetyltransferase